MDRQTDGQLYRQTDGQTDKQTDFSSLRIFAKVHSFAKCLVHQVQVSYCVIKCPDDNAIAATVGELFESFVSSVHGKKCRIIVLKVSAN
jgi:hypothetical protein